jgi:hypothetical protein
MRTSAAYRFAGTDKTSLGTRQKHRDGRRRGPGAQQSKAFKAAAWRPQQGRTAGPSAGHGRPRGAIRAGPQQLENYQQAAYQPWGNGINDQTAPLSFAASWARATPHPNFIGGGAPNLMQGGLPSSTLGIGEGRLRMNRAKQIFLALGGLLVLGHCVASDEALASVEDLNKLELGTHDLAEMKTLKGVTVIFDPTKIIMVFTLPRSSGGGTTNVIGLAGGPLEIDEPARNF